MEKISAQIFWGMLALYSQIFYFNAEDFVLVTIAFVAMMVCYIAFVVISLSEEPSS